VVEAGKRFEQRGKTWDRFRWAAGLAAAAALVLVVALNLGRGDQQNAAQPASAGSTGATGAAAEAGAAADSAVPFLGVERQPNVSYDDAGILALAIDARDALTSAAKDQTQTPAPRPSSEALSAAQRFAAAPGPRRCIQQSGLPTDSPDPPDPGEVRGRAGVHRRVRREPGGGSARRPRRGLGGLEHRLQHPQHGISAGHPGLTPAGRRRTREDSSAYS
jgi:hypothetical protein